MSYFAQCPQDVVCDPALTSSAVRVFCYIDLRAGADGWRITYKEIAAALGMDRATVRRAARELLAAGHLALDEERPGYFWLVPYRGGMVQNAAFPDGEKVKKAPSERGVITHSGKRTSFRRDPREIHRSDDHLERVVRRSFGDGEALR